MFELISRMVSKADDLVNDTFVSTGEGITNERIHAFVLDHAVSMLDKWRRINSKKVYSISNPIVPVDTKTGVVLPDTHLYTYLNEHGYPDFQYNVISVMSTENKGFASKPKAAKYIRKMLKEMLGKSVRFVYIYDITYTHIKYTYLE